jgi:hypothetical protein
MLSWVRFAYPRAFARLAPAAGAHLANKAYVDGAVEAAVENAEGYADSVAAGKLDIAAAFGQEQTWQNVKANRALATAYTNTTGRPIALAITSYNVGGTPYMNLYINGILFAQPSDKATSATTCYLFFVVLPGDAYSIEMRAAADFTSPYTLWYELR